MVVVAINDPTATREIVETVRNLTDKAHLIVRTRYLTEMKPLYDLGANEVIPEEFETSVEIFSRVLANYLVPMDEIDKLVIQLRSDGYEMFRKLPGKSSLLSNIDLHLPEFEVASIRIEKNSPMVGNTLLDLELRKKHGVTVLAVRHDSKTFSNPEVDAPFYVGDILYVVGTPEKLAKIRPLFMQNGK